MIHIKLLNFLNGGLLVIYEDFQINISQQVQVYLVPIVSDGHDERAVLIEKADLPG